MVREHSARKLPTVTVMGFALAGEGLARITAEVARVAKPKGKTATTVRVRAK